MILSTKSLVHPFPLNHSPLVYLYDPGFFQYHNLLAHNLLGQSHNLLAQDLSLQRLMKVNHTCTGRPMTLAIIRTR
jgi:hypothetical protein